MDVGYLPHSFDLINVRDLELIEAAKKYCSQLVVGVFSDEFAERALGRRPVVPLIERVALVSHLRGVDEVMVHDGEMPHFGAETTYFSVADEVALPFPNGFHELRPTRRSASPILRRALELARAEYVA